MNWIGLDWIGSIPGRRESRRFMGDYILRQDDILEMRYFDDAIGFGGWSLDEHNPGGIENLKEPASYFHAKSKKVYEVPYSILYSKNISNLSLAGRNTSLTHIVLSSTRITGTCCMMGQAVGTGAAMCVKKGIDPRELRNKHINELQEQLLCDDSFIPNRPAADDNDLARKAKVIFGSSTASGDVNCRYLSLFGLVQSNAGDNCLMDCCSIYAEAGKKSLVCFGSRDFYVGSGYNLYFSCT